MMNPKKAYRVAEINGPGYNGMYELSEPFSFRGFEVGRVFILLNNLYRYTGHSKGEIHIAGPGTPSELFAAVGYSLASLLDREPKSLPDPKPVLGLRPEAIWHWHRNADVRSRAYEVASAIQRYATAGKPIPAEWTAELLQRIDDFEVEVRPILPR